MDYPLHIAAVPIIAAIVYAALEVYKRVFTSERTLKFIPLIAAALGIVLGIVKHYAVPDIMPTANVLTAIFLGLASGLAATGTHQIFRQIGNSAKKENAEQEKDKVEEKPSENEDKDTEEI